MKKVNTHSAQYKIIPQQPAQLHAQLQNQNQNYTKNTAKLASRCFAHKKKLSTHRQEFMNNIAASGFKQFNL